MMRGAPAMALSRQVRGMANLLTEKEISLRCLIVRASRSKKILGFAQSPWFNFDSHIVVSGL